MIARNWTFLPNDSRVKKDVQFILKNQIDRSLLTHGRPLWAWPFRWTRDRFDLVYWNNYNRSLKSPNSLNMSAIRLKLKPKFFGSEYGRKFQELSSGISVSSFSLSHSHLVDTEIMMNEKRVENFIFQRFKNSSTGIIEDFTRRKVCSSPSPKR